MLSGTAGYVIGAMASKNWLSGWSSLAITIAALWGTAAVEGQCRLAQARFRRLSALNERMKGDQPEEDAGA